MSYSSLGQTIRRIESGGSTAFRSEIPWGTVALVGGGITLVVGAIYVSHQMRESVRRSAGDEGVLAYDLAHIARALVTNRRTRRRRR